MEDPNLVVVIVVHEFDAESSELGKRSYGGPHLVREANGTT
jgi:hypothetical protein